MTPLKPLYRDKLQRTVHFPTMAEQRERLRARNAALTAAAIAAFVIIAYIVGWVHG